MRLIVVFENSELGRRGNRNGKGRNRIHNSHRGLCVFSNNVLEEFPIKFKQQARNCQPTGRDMFNEDLSEKSQSKERETFHRFVAKCLFLCKRARPDMQLTTVALCTRVKLPGRNNWNKLVQVMKFLSATTDDELCMSAGKGVSSSDWFSDALFAVHPDFGSHSGSVGKFRGGKGSVICGSDKQKSNTNSSMTAESVAMHQCPPETLHAPLFSSEQGCNIEDNAVFQDNKSTILLESN